MSRSVTFHDFCNPTAAEEEAFLRNARFGRGGFRGCDLPTTPEDELPPENEEPTENNHRRGLLHSSTFSSWLQLLISKKRRGNILSFSQRRSFMRPSISLCKFCLKKNELSSFI